jgi:Tol biopolymer transport system component
MATGENCLGGRFLVKRRAALAGIGTLVMVILSLTAVAPANALSPLPGRIYALADVGGTPGDVFRTTPLNSWLRLSSGLSFPESVSGSPDGSFSVVCASIDGVSPYRIYRVPAAGGRLRNLIGDRQGCGQSVSPDGSKVAYIGRGSSTLNVVRSRGGRQKTLYRFCSSCIYSPAWANGRIYFERRVSRNPSADLEIYSVRARDGRKLRRHTSDGATPIDRRLVDVSKDGRKLLVVEWVPGPPATYSLSVITLSRSGASRGRLVLFSGSDGIADASFSPDGGTVAYSKRMTPSELSPLELWLTPATGGGFASLFSSPAISTNGPYSIDWVRR